ncbi:MAG: SMP-30/gluconolactonase/LRE family protein, partial [Gammaproteobacteria bacterium]|nr:SMP-30/gluconolactonase/LRE family protein [Gammaproteobacteria bacterium]
MKRKPSSIVFAAAVAALVSQHAVAQSGSDLIVPGASVVKLADGFVFTEGPAADAEGNVYFSDTRGS